jgi:hypothetical protein
VIDSSVSDQRKRALAFELLSDPFFADSVSAPITPFRFVLGGEPININDGLPTPNASPCDGAFAFGESPAMCYTSSPPQWSLNKTSFSRYKNDFKELMFLGKGELVTGSCSPFERV